MIEKTTSFKTSDGRMHATVEDAQRHVLTTLIASLDGAGGLEVSEAIAAQIVARKDEVIDALTMKATSHPKARKLHGATRNRKPKPATVVNAAA